MSRAPANPNVYVKLCPSCGTRHDTRLPHVCEPTVRA